MGVTNSVGDILEGVVSLGDNVSVFGWLCSDGFDCWLIEGDVVTVERERCVVLAHPHFFDRCIAPLGMLSAGGELCFAENAIVVGTVEQVGSRGNRFALGNLQKVAIIDDDGKEVRVDLSGPPRGPVVIE